MPQHLPSTLRDAFAHNTWPLGRLSGEKFAAVWKHVKCDLELARTLEEIAADTSYIAGLCTLQNFNRERRTKWHLYDGSITRQTKALPWLDTSSATVIGGGADYGDDLWLVLDLRTSQEDPAVIFNVFTAPNGARAEWSLAAPSLTEFLRQARS
jgi:hypothetical protein